MEGMAEHTDILSLATSKSAPPRWSSCMEDAFSQICKLLYHSCVLTIPLPSDRFLVTTDASALGISGVLQVWQISVSIDTGESSNLSD